MSKFIAYIIDTLNHDSSISDLLIPSDRIWNIVAEYKGETKKEETAPQN
jgi:ribose-phosphate pyrophosphokinase